jgi:hypothetical protein
MRIYAAAILLLGLYLLPWVVNPSVSLTANGYDLAEWSSLHPAVQAQTPMLLTSLLLRLPLACVALLIAFCARRNVLAALVVLVTAVALLPPLEFVRDFGNPNYRQLAALALITLVGGGVGLSGFVPRYHRLITAGVALVGAAAGLLGLAQAYDLMRGFGLAAQIGAGGPGLILMFMSVAGALAISEIRQRRRDKPLRLTSAVNQTG